MDYPAFLTANALEFLNSRGLPQEELSRLAHKQGFEDALLLLTSSPVHGIATATSDIDLICISTQAVSRAQMATQIHHQGQHVELLPFCAADVETSFAAWSALARCDLPDLLAGYQRWDATNPVRRKYLERLVYGVELRGGTPFVSHLGSTAHIVAAADFDTLQQAHACAWLAARAGETHAARGYLLNACLSAMSVLLSLGGWVVSNKKWTLRRWTLAQGGGMDILDAALQRTASRLWAALTEPATHTSRSLDLLDQLRADLARLLTQGPSAALHHPAPTEHLHSPMDARSAFIHGDAAWSRMESSAALPETPADLDGLRSLPPDHAQRLLRAVRCGEWACSLRAPDAVNTKEPADAAAQ
ncbi:DUF6001 family protein [Piscinibacter terrae]|uniref:Nucleotidyltransferase domain-containing protein n=1 Tax=Piscinibacter terrae TaxID=2496871 RepID=A0A3N7HI80_9BURK|nr:DUF6001 family protein [Albitalea terrae]RQP21748.1 hypothetical protein DZC73_25215 [Albitalea terrae]